MSSNSTDISLGFEGLLPEKLMTLNPSKNLPNKCGIEPTETTRHSFRVSRIIHAERIRGK